jgi:hypothetical protein
LENIKERPNHENHNEETAAKIWLEYNKGTRSVLPIIKYDYTVDIYVYEIIERISNTIKAYYG